MLYVDTQTAKMGTSGNNTLNGGSSADTLDGLGRTDTLNGKGGNDWLFGGSGDDKLNGDAGNDWLFGQLGSDVLTGGLGADKFVSNQSGFGADQITDFSQAQGDKVDLRGLHLAYEDLVITHSAQGALITIGSDTISLIGIQATNLHSTDFLL